MAAAAAPLLALSSALSSSPPNPPSQSDQQHQGLLDLSPFDVALCVLLVAVQGLASWRLRLGLHAQLAVAAFRCVAQLSLLGVALKPIFTLGADRWWVVACYGAFMVLVAAFEASGRPSHSYTGLFSDVALVLALASVATIAYAAFVVLRLHPWWAPGYVIPIFGMILGNTITGVSVGLNAALEELASSKDRIERLLALGASRAEATAGCVGRATRAAMMPTINGMSVVGLVSIPGMMSGQILGGSDAGTAARYQMMVFFLIGAASTASAFGSVHLAASAVVDASARYRADRLVRKGKKKGGQQKGGWAAWARGFLPGRRQQWRARGGGAAGGGEQRQPLLAGEGRRR
jgi:putative ABC transport system permease protein